MRPRSSVHRIASFALAAVTGCLAASVFAASPEPDPDFGTASLSSITIGPYAFSPIQDDVTWGTSFIDNNVVIYHSPHENFLSDRLA